MPDTRRQRGEDQEIMGEYWLLDRHGAKGPSVLVETDGSMQITNVLRFGPKVTKLVDQQKIWDEVIGGIAPTLKPIVPASKLDEDGIDLHDDLNMGDTSRSTRRSRGSDGNAAGQSGRTAGGARRTGGRGRG